MKNIETILDQRMDRKEFLQYVGAGLAAVWGVGIITKTLTGISKPRNASQGYGSSAYGGLRR